MTIITREPLTKEDQQKIADIRRESNCPHESLRNTFPDRYNGLIGNFLIFDDADPKDYLRGEFYDDEDYTVCDDCEICDGDDEL